MRNIICILFVLGIILGACSPKNDYDDGVLGLLDTRSGSGGGAGSSNWNYAEAVVDEDVWKQEDIAEENIMENHNSTLNSAEKEDESTSIKKKIIKDGDITIQTNDIGIAKQGFDSLVKSLNGYYEQENLEKNYHKITYRLTIRVPANNFEKMLSSIEQKKDEIKSKNIRARDITEEFVDLTTRLSNKRNYLKQYTVLLSKATKSSEILEIQEKIRKLQEEIESAEGRLRYLNDQVTFSTLNVNLYKEVEYVYKPAQKDRFTERVKSGLSTGWHIIVGIVIFLINIWSVLLLLTLVFFFIRWRIKKRKERKNE
jgi:hypothetical protein